MGQGGPIKKRLLKENKYNLNSFQSLESFFLSIKKNLFIKKGDKSLNIRDKSDALTC